MYIPRYTGMSAYVCVQREEKKKKLSENERQMFENNIPKPSNP